MHAIEDLMRILGYNENQVRVRLKEFRSYLETRNGKNNKLFLTNSGLKVLERVKQLEGEGFTLDSIKTILDQELNPPEKDDFNGRSMPLQTDLNWIQTLYEGRIDDLRRTIQALETQLTEKDRQILDLTSIIKDRLPALPGEVERHQGLWQRVRKLVRGT